MAIAGLIASACSKPQHAPFSMPPPQVGVVTVAPHAVPTPFEFPGQVQPFRRDDVRSRVEGVIVARPFVEGSIVRPGQLLFQLDTVRYAAAYQSAVATYDNAKATLARMEPLLPRHAVAQQDVDNARTAVAASKAALDQATKDLEDTRIRAEIGGRVGRALLELGARVSGPQDVLTTIDQLNPVYISFRPSSEQVMAWRSSAADRALIQPGSPLQIRVMRSDSSLLPVVGRLDYVSPVLDSATGTQEFRARFDNRDGALVPGEFVHVLVQGFERPQALTVPQRAVLQGLGRQYVYVVGQGDTVSTRDVRPGSWTGQDWIIDSGLQPGDRVIVDGVQKVGPGRVVKPVAAADSATRSPAAEPAGGARP